ncbi:5'-nucleotidase [Nocardioides rubriscoriae]|uniref:5'-nucleotidase n=1 Tax=Nocardioides rubriscoriae TaxID=642762 RepID=UPI003CCC66BF
MPPYDLKNRLVIGVASSALFDLTDSDAYFLETNEEAYRVYQMDRVDDPLHQGAAFPFVQRLLGLNDLRPENPPVEVIILSKNDPVTGLRVMNSVRHHDLPITRAVFSRGRQTHQYMPALGMSLFLSESAKDVQAAIEAGHPAGRVLSRAAADDPQDPELRVAFDFDGVLGDDSAETVYKTAGGLGPYKEHELANRDVPIPEGPLKNLLADLNLIQDLETARTKQDPSYEPRLRIALVTARDAPAHERAVTSLRDWGVTVDEAFFLGGVEKLAVLSVLKPHIFFDDQTIHLDGAENLYAGVHVPYGIANAATPSPDA